VFSVTQDFVRQLECWYVSSVTRDFVRELECRYVFSVTRDFVRQLECWYVSSVTRDFVRELACPYVFLCDSGFCQRIIMSVCVPLRCWGNVRLCTFSFFLVSYLLCSCTFNFYKFFMQQFLKCIISFFRYIVQR
jgi:hypothetical protein